MSAGHYWRHIRAQEGTWVNVTTPCAREHAILEGTVPSSRVRPAHKPIPIATALTIAQQRHGVIRMDSSAANTSERFECAAHEGNRTGDAHREQSESDWEIIMRPRHLEHAEPGHAIELWSIER